MPLREVHVEGVDFLAADVSGEKRRTVGNDRPGTRFPVLPGDLKTTASIPWLRYPRAPGLDARNKLPHVVAFVLESHLHYLSRCGVQHRQRLLASVQITPYNSHLGLLRSEHCRVNTEQLTRAVARPASLWHQPDSGLATNLGRLQEP